MRSRSRSLKIRYARPITSKAERTARISGEFEASERAGKIDISIKSEHLKGAPEHLRMEQCLQGALRVLIGNEQRKFGDDSGNEVMLIGEPGHAQILGLRTLGHLGPVYVCGDVCFADQFERRIEISMLCARLHHFAKLVARKSIIDRDDESTL